MSLNEYTCLLDEAQELVNAELKDRFEKGEITSPYEIFYETSYLDVIQIFNYSLDYWNDVAVNQELRDLICLIEVHNVSEAVAKTALKLIAAYILHTETCHYWNYQSNGVILKRLLHKHFPAHKPLNYDYLRLVINTDICITNEKVAIVSQ